MENEQYLKYKDDFKKQCVYNVISSCFSIITMLFIFFLNIFNYHLKAENVSIDFSLFNITKEIFSNLNNLEPFSFAIYIFLIGSIVFFIIGIFQSGFFTFKNFFNVFHLEDYSITKYDEIKSKSEYTNLKKQFRSFASNQLFYVAIVYFLFALIFIKSFKNTINGATYYIYLLAYVNGTNALIILPIITFIITIIFSIMSKQITKKIRLSILKEDYKINEKK